MSSNFVDLHIYCKIHHSKGCAGTKYY
uniref:Uncharacterized protein n=1 Tax=Arundo donax TaxID=35708 RepID=A0A0A9BVX1_ARUDO